MEVLVAKIDFKKLGQKAKASSKKDTSKAKASTSKAPAAAAKGKGEKFSDDNRFVLFVNDKDGNDARPDYTGKVTIVLTDDLAAGTPIELRLAAWMQDSDKVGQYISGRVSEPQEK
jgi:hypothetical protein